MSNMESGKRRRRWGVPLVLILIIAAVTATWIGLTLAGHSIEKPNAPQTTVATGDRSRVHDLQAGGSLDPDAPEWKAKYGEGHPGPVTPGAIAADAAQGECTLAVFCHTAVAKGMAAQERWRAIVPASGVILSPTAVEFRQGESVFDVLKRALQAARIQMEFSGFMGAQYVAGIHNLYEFDGGPDSGWMYSVNGWYPHYGCGQYQVQQGDAIEWNYTCDLGRDLGQDWPSP